ncbi:MAG: aminotransferase class I/II-fold pyridoxal phosphate-dependent enzyme [Sinobacteraceae bacterium]|nr:aminotransferase class I/II-fold pyridoxal phosphate-dependent enzyme [Nevskiaceae bacterium]MCP5359676.1 aminotransferase class I/II-fold pyridoxal phosphate-dependent enzyme [Nevskiaceae bacterium]
MSGQHEQSGSGQAGALQRETRVNHPPRVELPPDNQPLTPPIYQSVKYEFGSVEETVRAVHGKRPGFFYSRSGNPTVRQLELLLADLQGRDDALACASGVNAVMQALFTLTSAGDHVLCFAETYGPTRQIIRRFLARFGVRHTLLSIEDLAGIERTLATVPTRLVFFESPTNPVTKVADIAAITRLAHVHGALAVLDNTFAGFHQHGEYDVDLFIHSLTKYAAGTGDVMGGVVIGRHELIQAMRPDWGLFGAQLDPHAAFLLMRGMKTYFLRYRAQCAAALELASFLAAQPGVERVRYPGLPTHPQAALARAQMREFGSVVTFDIAAGAEAARRFTEALQLFAIAASLGSTESLVLPPQMMQPRDATPEQLAWSDIRPGTVRLSIGLEDLGDLRADLAQALAVAAAPG